MSEDEIEAILRAAGAEYQHMGRGVNAWCMDGDLMPMIEALLAAKPALVAPAEPVGCYDGEHRDGADMVRLYSDIPKGTLLYTSPMAAPVAPMSQPNRLVAYAASQKLRELGYAWENEVWVKT